MDERRDMCGEQSAPLYLRAIRLVKCSSIEADAISMSGKQWLNDAA